MVRIYDTLMKGICILLYTTKHTSLIKRQCQFVQPRYDALWNQVPGQIRYLAFEQLALRLG